MTRKEIAHAIADETNLTQVVVKDIMQRLFDGIIDTLEKERRIELRDFGVFEVKQRKVSMTTKHRAIFAGPPEPLCALAMAASGSLSLIWSFLASST
jgi:hypothetical protein